MREYGYEKIVKVDPQVFTDDLGRAEFAIVWLVTDRGDVYERTIRVGETVESVAAFYSKRGWTDDQASYSLFNMTNKNFTVGASSRDPR